MSRIVTPRSFNSVLGSTPFGLYRPGSELRGVFYRHRKRVIEACTYWREQGKGCDEPILLGEYIKDCATLLYLN